MSKTERNFRLDWMMFIVFSITVVSGFLLWLVMPHSDNSAFAGIDRVMWLAFHIGSGFLGLLGVIIHIVWHWRWLKALRGRSLRTLKRPLRANRMADRLTWISFIATNISGLLVAAFCRFARRISKNIRPLSRGRRYYLVGFSSSPLGVTSTMDCFGHPTLFAFWLSN